MSRSFLTSSKKPVMELLRRNSSKRQFLELKLHAAIEEELFYPAVRQQAGDDLINEADEEHHVTKLLIAELEKTDSSADHYDAKFTVLGEMCAITFARKKTTSFRKPRAWTKIGKPGANDATAQAGTACQRSAAHAGKN